MSTNTVLVCCCITLLTFTVNYAAGQAVADLTTEAELPSTVQLLESTTTTTTTTSTTTTTTTEAPTTPTTTTEAPTTVRTTRARPVRTTAAPTTVKAPTVNEEQSVTEAKPPGRGSAGSRRSSPAPQYQCPFEEGLFADPESCRRFYTCSQGTAFVQNCPPGLFFDDRLKFCSRRDEAKCGPIDYVTTPPTPLDENLVAKKCDPAVCKLPDCYCSVDGTQIPGGLNPEQVPQMVVLTFTGGINLLNFPYYRDLLQVNRTNPNGCRVLGTFYVSHDYTNYQYVQRLYAMGNEIGVNSISNRKPEEYWYRGSYENWTMEMVGMRDILETFAGIPKEDILGVRGPYTKSGGNEQFDMMNDYAFAYDATMTTPLARVPTWPFSLDYKMPFKCRAGNCPSYTYPGIWELPINMLYSEDGEGGNCAFLDQCVFLYGDEETIFNWLMENFNRHYNSNRAPLGINLQTSWFLDKERLKALNRFIDAVLAKGDSYFVTSAQALQWVIEPTPLADIAKFQQWACPTPRQPACNLPKTCSVPFEAKDVEPDVRYMQTCFKCPKRYPWVGNAKGEDKDEPDVYTPEIHSENSAPAA
ncbi:putative inactive cytidine deaminase 4 [Chamberlinius hualienensis]